LIDIHSHIIPKIDDGAADISESIDMLRAAAAAGVTLIVATPHCASYPSSPRTPQIALGLQELAAASARDSEASKVELAMGAEILLDPGVREVLDGGGIPVLGGTGKHVLVELPMLAVPDYTEATLFELKAYGYVPIIAHPERNHELSQDMDLLCRLINMGVLVQLDAGSIVGAYGSIAEQGALTILKRRMCHFIASDAHSPTAYSRLLPQARQRTASLMGEETATELFEENPKAILEGITPKVPEPVISPKADTAETSRAPARKRERIGGLAGLFKGWKEK
jgi:protein-tyrosine phosphatase